MPRPGDAEMVRVALPDRNPRETRWRYDVIRGDRLEAEATVAIDQSVPGKTTFTITADDDFPPGAVIAIFAELSNLIRSWANEEEDDE